MCLLKLTPFLTGYKDKEVRLHISKREASGDARDIVLLKYIEYGISQYHKKIPICPIYNHIRGTAYPDGMHVIAVPIGDEGQL